MQDIRILILSHRLAERILFVFLNCINAVILPERHSKAELMSLPSLLIILKLILYCILFCALQLIEQVYPLLSSPR